MERVYAYIVSLVLIGAALWPAFLEPLENDSYPLSTYPMFSTKRPTRLWVTHAVGTSADGSRTPLSPMISSGNRAVLQSSTIVLQGVRHDADAACAEVAARVAPDPDLATIEHVELSTDLFDTIAYFSVEAAPLERKVHTRCDVRR